MPELAATPFAFVEAKVCLDGGGMANSDLPSWNSDVGIAANGGVRPQDLLATDAGGPFEDGVEIVEVFGEISQHS